MVQLATCSGSEFSKKCIEIVDEKKLPYHSYTCKQDEGKSCFVDWWNTSVENVIGIIKEDEQGINYIYVHGSSIPWTCTIDKRGVPLTNCSSFYDWIIEEWSIMFTRIP